MSVKKIKIKLPATKPKMSVSPKIMFYMCEIKQCDRNYGIHERIFCPVFKGYKTHSTKIIHSP